MKKVLCIILAACMLCGGALAQMLEPAFTGVQIPLNEKTAVDLDGDGVQEEILLQIEGVDGEEELAMYIFDADGGVTGYTMYVRLLCGAFAADLDGDGLQEIMVSADFYSDDYCTYAFNYSAEGGLKTLNFKNVNRGEAEEGYCDNGYGMVTAVDGDSIILTGSQDVLGTWMASRTFSLQNGQFETADDGYFRMLDITADAEIWEYFCLIPTVEIAAKFSDGSEGKIMPGEKFVVTMSDRTSIVHFETQDGKTGSFEIAPNDEYGWGSLVGGVSEEECFEYVPYAD